VTVASHRIPIIEISGLVERRHTAVENAAAALRSACLDTGFFYVVGHGVDAELIADAFEQNRRFHALPDSEKLRIKLNQWHRGYEPLASSKLTSSSRFAPATHPNQLESFFLRHEVPSDGLDYSGKELAGPNQWPDDPAFRVEVRAYERAVRELGIALLPAVSMAVGEHPDFFLPYFDPPSTALRLIHYPAAATDRPRELLGIQPHTDYGFLTILAQDEVGGLEVRRVDGTWIEAAHVPGSFVVNIGDALARWTNDVFNSTPHRVVAKPGGRDRYSIAMFFDPNVDTEIRCLSGFTRNGPPKYPPIRYGEYFRMRLDSNFPDRAPAVHAGAKE